MLTQEYLKSVLSYDPGSGKFTWLKTKTNAIKVGDKAGHLHLFGYLIIRINYNAYRAHRLAWLYHYGEWPVGVLDHRNGKRDDNRINNLRECTKSQNKSNSAKCPNNTSGNTGVVWESDRKKWRAQIQLNNKNINLGRFTNIEGAIAAREAGEIKHFGEFKWKPENSLGEVSNRLA